MLKKDEIKQKEALEIIAKKQRISKPTFVKWCNEGVISFRTEVHGMHRVRVFKRSEIEQLTRKIRKNRIIGLSLIPK